jgi:hypothetical protein
MFSTAPAKSIVIATAASFAVSAGKRNTPLFHGCEQHGDGGKELLAMPLEEACRRTADGDQQIEPLVRKKGAKIIDERPLLLIGETRCREGSLIEIYRLRRLPI